MVVIVTDESNGRKYKLQPDNNGLSYQLWKTSLLKPGEKARNGKAVKNEWQFTGKYPRDITNGLSIISDMILKDPESKDTIAISTKDISNLQKFLKKHLDSIKQSIKCESE